MVLSWRDRLSDTFWLAILLALILAPWITVIREIVRAVRAR